MEFRAIFAFLLTVCAVCVVDGCWWSFDDFMDVTATDATSVGRAECPDPSTLGDSDEAECSSDDDCDAVDDVTYICCDTNGGGYTCAEYTLDEGEKEGTCPYIDTAECVEDCVVDDDCTGEQKCCLNGCGHECADPDEGRPGECPPSSELKTATSDECSVDDDCNVAELCCENRNSFYECAGVSDPIL